MTVEAVPTKTKAQQAVEALQRQRADLVTELSHLTEDECRLPANWGGMTRTVNFVLRAFSLHDLDHIQHLERLLRARDKEPNEAVLLLRKAQALRAEIEAVLLSLSDEEFEAAGPGDAWSASQLVNHLTETDARYRDEIRRAVSASQAKV